MATAHFGRVFVAKFSASCSLDGEQFMVLQGDTVREGHPLLEKFPDFFAPQRVKFEHLVPTQAPVKKPSIPRKG